MVQSGSETTNEAVEALPTTTFDVPRFPSAPSSSDASFWSSNAGQPLGVDWRQFLDIEAPDPEHLDSEPLDPDATNRDVADPGLPALLEPGTAPGSTGAASIFDLLPAPNDDLLPNW